MIANELAKMLLCLNDTKYCNNCKSCLEFDNNNQPDFLQISPDGNSIKIEQIRELQKRIQEKPIISSRKVYIIDDADLMTQESQNCLLKTLEEPPAFSTIILIGSNENAFLPTIKSRCMILHFQKIEDEEMRAYLANQFGLTNVSQNMLDKVINHLVSRHILYPALLPCLLDVNVASRKGLGTSEGIRLAMEFHRICKIKYGTYYVLKCDISKFFASIDHDILKSKLKKRIKDKDALKIVFDIIDMEKNGLSIRCNVEPSASHFFLK